MQEKVSGPATALLVTGIIGLVLQVVSIILNVLGIGLKGLTPGELGSQGRFVQMLSGSIGIVSAVIGIIVSLVIIYGATQMKNLTNWGFSVAVSIIAMIPCISPCCILGIPFGIWALTVLYKPEVRQAFH